MNTSKVEEVIGALWVICAILCFHAGFTTWGWFFAIKAALDIATSINYAIKEVILQMKMEVKDKDSLK